MYSGVVKGVGPRYCPSIEDKLVRFADKPRHQIFLEPESESLDTTYIQGFSTSLPRDLQEQMVHSLPGLEQVVIEKYAYAIEYDAVDPLQLRFDARLFRFGKLHPDPYVGFVGGVYANPSFFQICEQVVRRPAGSGGCVRCGRCLCPGHAVKSVRVCQSPFVLLIPRLRRGSVPALRTGCWCRLRLS